LIKWLTLQLSNLQPIKEREDLEDVEEDVGDVEAEEAAVVAEEVVQEEELQRMKAVVDGFQLPSLDVSLTRS
jgi:nitrogen regulatory protein PII-like uncharacterized protein